MNIPNLSDANTPLLKEKLLTAFIEACQSFDPSPQTILNLYKVILRKIQVSKLCDNVVGIDGQETILLQLISEIEPTVWCKCATFWLYTIFMNQGKKVYEEVLTYCISQID